MCYHVPGEIVLDTEGSLAHYTHIWLFPGVNPTVTVEAALLDECCTAHTTRVGLELCVYTFVSA